MNTNLNVIDQLPLSGFKPKALVCDQGSNNMYIYILLLLLFLLLFWWSPFIPSRNLDEVFTYNHMALMSL